MFLKRSNIAVEIFMEKIEFERKILDLAKPVLQSIYGNFLVDKNQIDKPDVAIDIVKPKKYFGSNNKTEKLGVEITTIDSECYKAYAGDKKKSNIELCAQLQNIIEGGDFKRAPLKSMDVKTPRDYIYNGLKRKSEKYHDYLKNNNFKEIILVCASNIIDTRDIFFINGMMQWTNYLLSNEKYPFDRVVFTSFRSRKSVEIYCKNNPMKIQPSPYEYDESSVTVSESSIIPMGRTMNYNDLFNLDPIIEPRKK